MEAISYRLPESYRTRALDQGIGDCGPGLTSASSEIQEQVRSFAEVVTPTQTVDIVKEDPPDNRMIECAIEGRSGASRQAPRICCASTRWAKSKSRTRAPSWITNTHRPRRQRQPQAIPRGNTKGGAAKRSGPLLLGGRWFVRRWVIHPAPTFPLSGKQESGYFTLGFVLLLGPDCAGRLSGFNSPAAVTPFMTYALERE
jgi:hypothetical protein